MGLCSTKRPFLSLLTLCALCFDLWGCGGGGGSSSQSPNGPLALNSEIVATNLNFPVDIAFAPDKRIFFSEFGTGKINVVQNGSLLSAPFYSTAPGVGNEGLSGIALDPRFNDNHFLYFFFSDTNARISRVVRVTDDGGHGVDPVTIVDNIPANGHNGGRLVFGDDGDTLYISTGDAGVPDLAQDDTSLAGKILKVNVRVSPLTPQIFAKGFRNPFGMALRSTTGDLYCSDNGPTCDDEINIITQGGNYGWRSSQPCNDTDPRYIQPLINTLLSIAPTGVTFYEGSAIPELNDELLVADFNTGSLRAYLLDESSGSVIGAGSPLIGEGAHFESGQFGSLLDVAVGPDGDIYVATKDSILKLSR